MRIVITDHPFPSTDIERRALRKVGAELVLGNCVTEEEVLNLVRDADGILVTYAPITERVIDSLVKCRIISRYGIGLDNIDLAAATRRGILVTYVPDYCVNEVSDHAMALLLAWARRITLLDRAVHDGDWDFRPFRPFPRLAGKTLGLLGFGKIGRAVAGKAGAFNMRVLTHDPYVTEDMAQQHCCELVRCREELFSASDVISVHMPLTPETRGSIGARELSLMKDTAFLINTARAEIIDEDALYEALRAGRPAGAGLDVLANRDPGNKLYSLPQVILTPHAAFYSEESILELQTRAVGEVVRAFTGEPPLCPANSSATKR